MHAGVSFLCETLLQGVRAVPTGISHLVCEITHIRTREVQPLLSGSPHQTACAALRQPRLVLLQLQQGATAEGPDFTTLCAIRSPADPPAKSPQGVWSSSAWTSNA